jgi:hypothetical protein
VNTTRAGEPEQLMEGAGLKNQPWGGVGGTPLTVTQLLPYPHE